MAFVRFPSALAMRAMSDSPRDPTIVSYAE
jgi:hypothetical protein